MWGAAVARSLDLTLWLRAGAVLALGLACTAALPAPLTVCMAADNAPLSHQVSGQPRGLDLRIAQAAASGLGRELAVVLFETEYEKESALVHEVGALLASGVCDAASGFPLLTGDLGPPSRASARTPDYPGAKRKRERPFITLQPLAASRAYQAVALGVVQRSGAPPLERLSDLGERKLGTVSGTLASAVALTWRNGRLQPNVVSLNQREDALAELAELTHRPGGRRFDAVLLPLALFDGWMLSHPGQALVAAAYRRPIGVNLGFVTLDSATEVRAALDQAITQARADGQLARWAAAEGVSWAAPVAPEVSRGPSLADLAAD